MREYRLAITAAVIAIGALGGCSENSAPTEPGRDVAREEASEEILTVDHLVPHVSTNPANAGEPVQLFLRERVKAGLAEPVGVVLALGGRRNPAGTGYDLPFEDYSWMAYLARAGFDVFALDLQGYGFSTRPKMDDPCNTSPADQQFLIPNPLPAPCPPSYPFIFTTMEATWAEIDAAVEFIKSLRGVERVSFIGFGLGGQRAGGYAARHGDKVDKLFLYAGSYNRSQPSDPPAHPPLPGVPTGIDTRERLYRDWDANVGCPHQFDPAAREAVWRTTLSYDPVGSTWGTEGVSRFPVGIEWGWNQEFARMVVAPTLMIGGELDLQVPPAQLRALYEDIGSADRVLVQVACAGQQMVWEYQRFVLFNASLQWLRDGSYHGAQRGEFWVSPQGDIHRVN